jgi:hypothetical protein
VAVLVAQFQQAVAVLGALERERLRLLAGLHSPLLLVLVALLPLTQGITGMTLYSPQSLQLVAVAAVLKPIRHQLPMVKMVVLAGALLLVEL